VEAPPAAADTPIPGTGYVNPEARAAYDRGKQLADRGDDEAAIEQFSQALAIDSRFLPAYLERGKSFRRLQAYDLALESLSQATIYGARYPETFVERGQVYMKLRRYREAAADFREAVQLRPADYESQLRYARALVRLAAASGGAGSPDATADLQTAVAALDRAIRMRGDDPAPYFERGLARLELGQTDDAIADLQGALKLAPDRPRYLVETGLAYLRRAHRRGAQSEPDDGQVIADYERAIDALTRYLAAPAAGDGGTLPGAGNGSASDEDDDAPIRREDVYLGRAVARIALAGQLSDSGTSAVHYRAAIEDCEAALRADATLTTAYFHRGLAQRMLDEYAAAIDSFGRALALSPEFAEALLRRGIAWFYLGDYELALRDFAAARVVSPDSRSAFWAGAAQARAGRHAEAVQEYSRAIGADPEYRHAYLNRGLAYLRLGMGVQAARDFNEVLRREPNHARAYYWRGLAYRQAGQFEAARKSFREALRLDPNLGPAQQAQASLTGG